MDWIQVITLGSYLTVICGFLYYFNERNIKEWRAEHSKQIENSEKHWREMFMHFNNRLDETKNE